jgi:hypothetical protein
MQSRSSPVIYTVEVDSLFFELAKLIKIPSAGNGVHEDGLNSVRNKLIVLCFFGIEYLSNRPDQIAVFKGKDVFLAFQVG